MHPASTPSQFTVLAKSYLSAIQDYLADSTDERAFRYAAELGQGALDSGFGVLDMTSIHQITMVTLLSKARDRQEQARVARAAAAFFLETLTPFSKQPALSKRLA